MLRRHFVQVVFILAAFIAGSLLVAQSKNGGDPTLQGNWIVVGAGHGGGPMEGLDGGTMTVTNERFVIHTAGGSLLNGVLRVDRTKMPAQIDLVHDNGTVWEAVYAVDGNDFRLNYVAAGGKDKRPDSFKTSPETEASLVILKRKKD